MVKQNGLSFIGLLFLVVIAGFIVLLVLKLVPVYIEDWEIRKVLTEITQVPEFHDLTARQIRESFAKRAGIDNITRVHADDLNIASDNGNVTVGVDYSVKVPIIANVSVCIDFTDSSG